MKRETNTSKVVWFFNEKRDRAHDVKEVAEYLNISRGTVGSIISALHRMKMITPIKAEHKGYRYKTSDHYTIPKAKLAVRKYHRGRWRKAHPQATTVRTRVVPTATAVQSPLFADDEKEALKTIGIISPEEARVLHNIARVITENSNLKIKVRDFSGEFNRSNKKARELIEVNEDLKVRLYQSEKENEQLRNENEQLRVELKKIKDSISASFKSIFIREGQ